MLLHELSLTQAAAKVRSKEVSPVELTEAALRRIEQVEPQVSAFATVTAELATVAAKHAATEIARGRYRGPLHGIPIGIKDLVDTAGILTTSSSAVRADHVPDADSAVTRQLYGAGAILVGKTFTHEFAAGALTPTTHNPWDLTRTPGGSSGGSAAAVAAGEVYLGLGTDTGGSIRVPASVCGTVGLKPTYGRVSRRGVTPLSWSADHVGPLTRTVEDAATVLGVIAGYDRTDPSTVDVAVPDYAATLTGRVDGRTVGVPASYFAERVDPEVAAATAAAIATLVDAGARVREVEIPMADLLLPTLWLSVLPEAAAYHEQMLHTKADLYGEDVRTLLEAGQLVPAIDYIRALRVRTLIQAAYRELFADIDVLVTPTLPTIALPAENPQVVWPDGTVEDCLGAYIRFCGLADITGLPALSVPAGFTSGGLPIGLQIIGRPFDEVTVLDVGHTYERATNWPTLAPLRRDGSRDHQGPAVAESPASGRLAPQPAAVTP